MTDNNSGNYKEQIKKELLLKQGELMDELSKYLKGDKLHVIESALDDGDLSVIALENDISLRQLTTHRVTLLKIDNALRKLDSEDYGVCEECTELINPERLKIMPYATFCRDCKEEKEKIDNSSGDDIIR